MALYDKDTLAEQHGKFILADYMGVQIGDDYYDNYDAAADALMEQVYAEIDGELRGEERLEALEELHGDMQILSVSRLYEDMRARDCVEAKKARIADRTDTDHIYATLAGWDRGVAAGVIEHARWEHEHGFNPAAKAARQAEFDRACEIEYQAGFYNNIDFEDLF
jgi:hypothetical protein